MKSPQKLLYAAGLGLLLSTSALWAESMSAKEIAQKAYAALDAQQSYAFSAAIVNHTDDENKKHRVDVKVNRPYQLRIDVAGDVRNRSNYLNNGQYTVYDHPKNIYLHLKTADNIEDALDDLFDRFEIKTPLAQLLYTNMGERIHFDQSKDFGIVDLKGVECHYLASSDKVKEVHVWITTGENPQIIHYLVKDKTSKNNAYQEGAISWKDVKTISPSDFIFTIPKNAQEVFIK